MTDRYQCPDQLAVPMDELAQQFIYNPKIASIRFFTQQKFCSEETWKYYSHYARDLHQLCNEYIFSTYEGNRIFRYEIGLTRLSPIELINREGKAFQYNPYLSIINGKVTIVR